MVEVQAYRNEHFDGVKRLWEETFPDDPPWNRADVAIPAKLAVQPDLFLVAVDGDEIAGAALAGYDGHRGWLYSVAVADSHRRRGVATRLVREAEQRLQALGCQKINLQVRTSSVDALGFYRAVGFAVEQRLSMGKRLSD